MILILLNLLVLIIALLFVIHYLYSIINYLLNDMQSEDAKFLKRKVKSGSVDVHPTQKALIVNYQLEALILGQLGDPMHGDKKEFQKVIHLSSLNSQTDCSALAKEVVDKCNLIHPSKLEEVEQLIYYLKNRKEHQSGRSVSSVRSVAALGSRSRAASSVRSGPAPSPVQLEAMSPVDGASATITCVHQYVELLYEDIQDKIKGSALILQLARNPDNLIELSKNEALLSALSRVLREEWKRSIELSTNIVFTFFSFSTYHEFHHIILQYKIGSLCMDVIDFELKRLDQWKDTIDGKTKVSNIPEKTELPKSRIPEPKRRPKSGTWAVSDISPGGRNSRSLNSSYHEDLCSAADPRDRTDAEQLRRKLKALAKRQEQLLRVAFYLLLNIADNVKVEEKMHKKNIVGLLVGALQRHSNVDLSILIVSFLLKLSVYKENKDSMVNLGLVDRLPALLETAACSPDLLSVSLRLLFNLTFDTKLRSRMVKIGLLPKLISYISDDKHTAIVTKTLYHLSMDDRVKGMFAHTDCVTLVTDMILMSRSEEGGTAVLVALAVNLALHPRCAQLMAGAGRLAALAARAFRSTDLMLIKLVRNLSQHHENRHLFVEFVGDIASVVTANNWTDEAFVVECLGILGNILHPDLDILAIVRQYNLIDFLMNILDLENKMSEEVVLGGVVVCGAVAGEEAGGAALCAASAPALLVRLLRARQEDDDLVLQVVFAFRQLLKHPSSAAHLINNTEAPAYLIDLMLDKNADIRKLCESCLDVITQTDSEWAVRIKVERFRCHNGQWLSVVEGLGGAVGAGGGGSDPDLEPDLPPYLCSDYLSNQKLFPSGSQMSLNNADDNDSVMGESEMDSEGERDKELMVDSHTVLSPNNRFSRDLEDVDFALMGNLGFLTRSYSNSIENDSIMAMEFPLQD